MAHPSHAIDYSTSAPNVASGSSRIPSARRASETNRSEGTPLRRSWLPWLFVLAAILTALNYDLPSEVSSWYFAAANSHYLDYQALSAAKSPAAKKSLQAAFESLGEAIAWAPENAKFYAQRMSWQQKQGNFAAALEDVNRLVELLPNNPDGLGQRSLLLFRLGRYKEALASSNEQFELLKQARSPQLYDVLNQRAYLVARAAATGHATKKQVEQAIVDVRQALAEVQLAAQKSDRKDLDARLRVLRMQSMYCDTLGYLLFLYGDLDRALEAMQYAVMTGEYVREMTRDVNKAFEFAPHRLESEDSSLKAQMAVLYQHRGLILEKLGRKVEADRDFKRAKELGYDPASEDFSLTLCHRCWA